MRDSMPRYSIVHCVSGPAARCLSMLAALLLVAGCGKNDSQIGGNGGRDRSKMKFPVEVARVETVPVQYTVFAVGSIEPFEVVQATARVAGVMERVLFQEGRPVRNGAVLAEIEPDRYRVAVRSAQAALQKAEAAKADAEAGLARRESVIASNPGLIPGEEVELWRTKVLSTASDMLQAKALLEQAELNLRDAFVKAPVSGVIQSRTVQTGQYVQPGTVIATLLRRDPLQLRFKVPEQDAARIHPGMRVTFQVPNDSNAYAAVLRFVASSADISTRMVAITGEVTGIGTRLNPGAFAEVRVPVGGTRVAPVIPQTAIRPTERGFLAFTVENGLAREHVLRIGLRTADGRVEVLSGLSAGEQLVIRGAEALRDKAPVRIGGAGRGSSGQPGAGQPGGGDSARRAR